MEQLTACLEALVKKPILPELPVFNGEPLEDPQVFLDKLETHFQSGSLSNEEQTRVAAAQLRTNAAAWWTAYEDFKVSFDEFKVLFKERFDTVEVFAQLSVQYYGRKQRISEPVADFLKEKAKLATRLKIKPEDHMKLFISMMSPQLRPFMEMRSPKSMLDLMTMALNMEGAVNTAAPPKRAAEPAKPANAQAEPTAAARPPAPRPPKCQFCPEYHFHRHCPSLNHSSQSGNGQRAEPAATGNGTVRPNQTRQ